MNQVWTIVGAVTGVIAILVTITLFFYERKVQTQRIEIIELSRTNLINPSLASSPNELEVVYSGRKIEDLTVVQFRILNAGGKPIRPEDYERPLGLFMENVHETLWAKQTVSNPDSLKIDPILDGNKVMLPNRLLNPNDWFDVEVAVITGSDRSYKVGPLGRIAGVKEIELQEYSEIKAKGVRLPWWFGNLILLQGAISSILVGLLWSLMYKNFRRRR